jgi:hypothetical protein
MVANIHSKSHDNYSEGNWHPPAAFVEQATRQVQSRSREWGRVRLAWTASILMSHRTHWETQRGRYEEHSSKFSLSMKPKFNRSVRERNHFWRLFLASARRQLMARCWRQQQRGTCTQHNQTALPQLTVRLSISLVCWKQRIRRIVWKEMFVCGEVK